MGAIKISNSYCWFVYVSLQFCQLYIIYFGTLLSGTYICIIIIFSDGLTLFHTRMSYFTSWNISFKLCLFRHEYSHSSSLIIAAYRTLFLYSFTFSLPFLKLLLIYTCHQYMLQIQQWIVIIITLYNLCLLRKLKDGWKANIHLWTQYYWPPSLQVALPPYKGELTVIK